MGLVATQVFSFLLKYMNSLETGVKLASFTLFTQTWYIN
jgi:hypothetical protein